MLGVFIALSDLAKIHRNQQITDKRGNLFKHISIYKNIVQISNNTCAGS